MLTRSGWLTGIAGALLIFGGRVFGLLQLFVLGGAALGLVGLSIVWLAVRPRSLSIRRQVSSARLHAGDSSQVQVQVHNANSLRSPVLRITDDVAGTRGAELELPPLNNGESRIVGYRLPTDKRGVVSVGPLRTHLSDPLAFVRSVRQAASTVDVLVYPRTDHVAPPPRPPGDDARLADRQASQLGRSSDEFFALREYVLGDDLRRVHWPSTARFGEPMVRQDELPQQGRSTILLDCRSGSADPATFEEMVSAAASLAMACRRRDDLVRLVGTDGADTGFTPLAAIDPVLDYLAMVQQSEVGSVDHAVALVTQGNPGTIVALVGTGEGARAASSVTTRRNANATIVFGPDIPGHAGPGAGLASQFMVRVRPGDAFPLVWERALGARNAQKGRR